MKLINYNRGYIEKFTCSIHGTIKMTASEFEEAVRYLRVNSDTISKQNCYFSSVLLGEDLQRRIEVMDKRKNLVKKFYVNIRVGATEAIVKEYQLTGYKRGNYQLEVTI